jgi:hypothetical protein
MKRIVSVLVLSLTALAVSAQNEDETPDTWTFSGFFQQNLNQVNFTNWAAGGENSFSSTSKARVDANFNKDQFSWENYADLSYGIIKLEDSPMRKNTDKIDVFSKAGRNISPKTSISGIFNFLSQFDKGYKYPNDSVLVSNFMAPGYLTIALGLDYKPLEYLSFFVSPATGKFTFVLDQELANNGAFGVDPAVRNEQGIIIEEGRNVNPEFGSLIRIEFSKEVVKNVNINSRIVLFNNYTDSDVSNRKNTDVDWLTGINMPINRFITASIDFHVLYDHDIKIPKYETVNGEQVQVGIRPTTQIQQAFGIGLVYDF